MKQNVCSHFCYELRKKCIGLFGILAVLMIVMLFNSCGEDEPDSGKNDSELSEGSDKNSNDWAPNSLAGKVIRWNGKSGYNNRIEFFTENDMRANWASQSSSYTWIKTGKNTGKLNFICGQTVNYVTRVFRYYVVLEFTSKSEFKISGNYEITGSLNGDGTYQESGSGSYVDKLWGD